MPNVEFAKKAVVKVPQRSAFDKSFRNLLTTKCGTLTPLLCDEVIPNTTVNLKLAISATLPPLASETFMNVNLKAEAFFCPSRLLMLGIEDFFAGNVDIGVGSTAPGTASHIRVPVIKLDPSVSQVNSFIAPGSLLDYLGFRSDLSFATTPQYINALPVLAYNLIYDCWYRNSLVQKSPFDDNTFYYTGGRWSPPVMKFVKPSDNSNIGFQVNPYSTMRDGVAFCALRQRNFGSDFFTTATPNPQNGPAQKVSMIIPNGSDINLDYTKIKANAPIATSSGIYAPRDQQSSTGDKTGALEGVTLFNTTAGEEASVSFTISSLRAANSLQQWLERQNLSNFRWVDFLKANYNADLKDSVAQRPVYLGSASFPVYSKGVYQTAKDSNGGNNPFDSVGSRYGHAYAEGTNFIIDHFTAQEPGYIMVLVSLVPEATYSSGVNSYLNRYLDSDSYGELANPILQNVGLQPIPASMVCDSYDDTSRGWVFGYTDRFGDWMTRVHELHGLLRDGQSLDAFALQRNLMGVNLGISSSFLEIPTNFMDQVTAVNSAISNYGCWIDSYLDYKVVMPLARYSTPSLQDPAYEHGDTVVVNKRGRIME